MKRALIICILLSLLAGYYASAKAPVSSKQPTSMEAAQLSATLLRTNDAAELTPSVQFTLQAFKTREQRFLQSLVRVFCLQTPLPAGTNGHANVYPPLPHIPLVRLLLFPKHYFW